jgi:hypothetical protein
LEAEDRAVPRRREGDLIIGKGAGHDAGTHETSGAAAERLGTPAEPAHFVPPDGRPVAVGLQDVWVVRLTRLRSVDMNALGLPSRVCAEKPHRWQAPDRFAKCGAVVTELYSRHLAQGEPVPAQTWWVRLVPTHSVSTANFGDEAFSDGLGEVHEVPFDATVVDLPDMQRRTAILDFLQGNLLALAAQRGWPSRPFDDAYEACLTEGLCLDLIGKPIWSPDRRLRARAQFTLDGNGDGWSMVEFLNGGNELVNRSEAFDSPWQTRGFADIEKSLRWQSPASVSFVPWWYVGPWEGQQRIVPTPAT